jgi:hypothetical protein
VARVTTTSSATPIAAVVRGPVRPSYGFHEPASRARSPLASRPPHNAGTNQENRKRRQRERPDPRADVAPRSPWSGCRILTSFASVILVERLQLAVLGFFQIPDHDPLGWVSRSVLAFSSLTCSRALASGGRYPPPFQPPISRVRRSANVRV